MVSGANWPGMNVVPSAYTPPEELANAITDGERAAPEAGLAWARREAVEALARLSSPMMPHLAEEIYARLFPDSGHLVAELSWPEADPALLVSDSVRVSRMPMLFSISSVSYGEPMEIGGWRSTGD